jgi:hypothetical protein
LFDPIDGVDVSSLGSSSNGVGDVVVGVLPPIAGGVLGSAASGVDSLMEISSAAPLLSTWKLNNPKAISKPPDLAETAPVRLEMGSTVVIAGESKARAGVESMMLGGAVSTMVDSVMSSMVVVGVASMVVGAAMPTMVGDVVPTLISMADEAMSMLMVIGDAESTTVADGEPSTLVGVERLAMVGEGAGESVDLDPVVPTVGAN